MAGFVAQPGVAEPGQFEPGLAGTPPAPPRIFPQAALGLKAEIQLAGTWTDISQYLDHDQQDAASHPAAAVITRGRADELATSPTPQSVTFKAWNADGRFCSKNPNGAYYPNLTRNTPIRFSIPGTTGSGVSTFMQLATLATGYASCPDTASLDITGQIDVRIDFTPEALPMPYGDYGPGTTGVTEGATLVAKWSDTPASASWAFLLEANGQLSWRWFDGSSKQRLLSGGQVATIPLGQRIALRAIFVPATGTVTFYTASTMAGPWTVLSSATFGATTLNAGTGTPVTVGGTQYWAPLAANVYEAQVYNNSGVLVADPVFSAQAAGATSFNDAFSNTWSMNGFANITTFGSALRDYRFYGQISSLPVKWDPTGNDVWATITASGVLRRLQQGNQPNVYSTLRRFLQTSPAPYTPLAYWPCEETQGATQFASALPGGFPMTIQGAPSLAANSNFACSNSIPTLNGSVWSGLVGPGVATNQLSIRFLLTVPATTTTPNGAAVLVANITGGSCAYLVVSWQTGGSLAFGGYNSAGTQLFTTGPIAGIGALGSSALISVELGTIFGLAQAAIRSMAPGGVDGSFGLASGLTPGRVTRVTVNPAGNITDLSVGHVVVQSAVQPFENITYPLNAWWGEPAGVRFSRLCAENNIASRVDGVSGFTVPMGYQTANTLMNLLQECEDTDRGQVYDPRDFLGLAYRSLDSLTNQTAGAVFDYNQDHMAPPLEPTDDDLYVVNDVTATNVGGLNGGGSTSQATLNDGSVMSISMIGDYQNSYSVSTQYDASLTDEAGWILHAGTNNDERYPAVTVDLASAQPQIQTIAPSVEALDIGSYVQIVNTPSFLPPGPVNLLVWGYTEYLGDFCDEIVFNTIPESPYEVASPDDAVRGHADTDGSTLSAGVSSGATSLSVATTNASSPLWTTNAGDFPFDVVIDGERITVTNITGASSPQTFTVTRSVNGVVKAHLANAVVDLWQPAIAALTA